MKKVTKEHAKGGQPPFYVKKVEVQNLSCFGWGDRKLSVEFRPCPGWQSIVGSAGSGKTTLLKAIAATLMGPLVAYRGQLDRLLANGAALGTVKVKGSGSSFSMEWRRNAQDEIMLSLGNPTSFFGQEVRATNRADGGTLPIAGFGAARRLRGEVLGLEADLKEVPALHKVLTLFREGASLGRGEAWLSDLYYLSHVADSDEKKDVAKKHFNAVMAVLRDGLLPAGDDVVGFKTNVTTYPWPLMLKVRGAEIELAKAPDAHRAIVGLVLELCRLITTANDFSATGEVTVPAIVLIDEPELHLGTGEQQAFKQWLVTHFPNTQFIVATNSTDICDGEDEPIRLS